MEKNKLEWVRPIDVRPGDLLRTSSSERPQGVTVVDSHLVEPGTYGKLGRLRKPEWWIRTVWSDGEGRVQSQTERFKTSKFSEKCVRRLAGDMGIPEPT